MNNLQINDEVFLETEAKLVETHAEGGFYHFIEAGRHLALIREKLKNKRPGFKEWIEKRFKWSVAHSYTFIRIYETFGGKVVQHAVLLLSARALDLLTKAPEEVREEVIKQVEEKKLTEKEVKELIAKAIKEATEKTATRIQELEEVLTNTEDEHQKKLKKIDRKYKKEIENKDEQISELLKEPPVSSLQSQIDNIAGPLVTIIQHDNLVKMLSDLEILKEDILDELDMQQLERVIHALISLSRRAQSWSERLTPTNDKWKYRSRRLHEEGETL
jgi:hypothetical protein